MSLLRVIQRQCTDSEYLFHREPYSGGTSNVSRCFGPCHRNWRCPRVGAEGWKPHRSPGSLGAPHPPGDAAGKEHLLGFPSVLFLIRLICFSLCFHVKFINENDTSSYNRYRDHQFWAAPGLGLRVEAFIHLSLTAARVCPPQLAEASARQLSLGSLFKR